MKLVLKIFGCVYLAIVVAFIGFTLYAVLFEDNSKINKKEEPNDGRFLFPFITPIIPDSIRARYDTSAIKAIDCFVAVIDEGKTYWHEDIVETKPIDTIRLGNLTVIIITNQHE